MESIYAGVTFVPSQNYTTKDEKEIIAQASQKISDVVASKCFYDFFINRKLVDANGKTSAQVIEHLRSINDTVEIKLYYKAFGSAIAYRQPPQKVINLNRKAFSKATPVCKWAATMAHEGLGHALGEYGHSFKWNAQRDFSVPYSLGGSVRQNGGDAFTNCCH